MSVYAIGDIQGCFDELEALLDKINFDLNKDQLWFAGDLVNRGKKSLETLRLVKSLGASAVTVLGNHDLHLLAIDAGYKKDKHGDLKPIMDAPDRQELIDWLRQQPLLHHDTELGYTLVHAGLPPQWDLHTAQACAQELEHILQSTHYKDFLNVMYGDEPSLWSDTLQGMDRLRFICNAFTRLRFCDPSGRLLLEAKGAPGTVTAEHLPWFDAPNRKNKTMNILFGHWSTLGTFNSNGVHGLDTGCVWGGMLSALQIDIQPPKIIQLDCPGVRQPG